MRIVVRIAVVRSSDAWLPLPAGALAAALQLVHVRLDSPAATQPQLSTELDRAVMSEGRQARSRRDLGEI